MLDVRLANPFQAEFLDQERDVAEARAHVGGQRLHLRVNGIVQGLYGPLHRGQYNYSIFAIRSTMKTFVPGLLY